MTAPPDHPRRRARRGRRLGGMFVLALVLPFAVRAQDAPVPLYDQAVRALGEGLPRVAAYKLRAFLGTDPAPPARRAAVLALARALVTAPDAPAALALLEREFPATDPDAAFWRGQALAATGRWAEALESYSLAALSAGEVATRCQAHFGRGESLLALGRVNEAAAEFRALRDDPQLGEPARLRYAAVALDAGHLPEAASVLVDTPPAGPPDRRLAKERACLLGRLFLAERQPARAAQTFTAALARPEGLSERLVVDCYWGWTQACLDQHDPETAQDALENLLERYPHRERDPSQPFLDLDRTAAWLESLYAQDRSPDLAAPRRWSADGSEPARQARARLLVGRLEERAGHHERAEEIFVGYGDAFPDSPLRVRALLDLAALRLRAGRPNAARLALEAARGVLDAPPPAVAAGLNGDSVRTRPEEPAAGSWRTEVDVLDAQVCLAQNDGPGAARRFEAVADRLGSGPQAEAAAFNAVLGWLRATDADRFAAAEAQFAARFPGSRLREEFSLEEGLARAGRTPAADTAGRRRAAAKLREFLRASPDSPRAAGARIALAELAFERPRPALSVAWRELAAPDLRLVANDRATSASSPAATPASTPPAAATPAERDRAAYLAIWLADAPGPARDPEHAVALAKKFLVEHPDSALAAEARMKLGEMYFQREDYPNAQTQLELLAENSPDSPLAEPSLYLAGMSAVLSASPAGLDKAVALFERAARRNGPFRLRARLQQADVQNRLGRGRDALTLYDGVLIATANLAALRDDELEARCAALCGRGQTLISLAGAGSSDPAKFLRDAVGAFDGLAALPGASLLWRRQALTLKGQALEKLGDVDGALTAYHDALEVPEPAPAPNAAGATPPPEWTWFYRAGHLAALLLERRSQWEAAIAIYEKLAAADGPMKSEFENTLNRRRLEHFVWGGAGTP